MFLQIGVCVVNAARVVGVNDKGIRVGQWHQNAKLTDREVDQLLELRETEGWGYKRLAKLFDISVRHVRDICNGRKRNQLAINLREVRLPR